MRVLIIIVTYNFERWIDRCLGSLRESAHPADTVLIDNCSSDRTTQLVEQHYPEVRLIKNKENLGFGRANNIGMEIALREGYDAVFLLNQDAWIDPQTIGTLAQLCQEYPAYGILSPVHLTGNGDKPEQGFGTYTGIRQLSDLDREAPVVQASFINAAFWMIPVAVLHTVGGFSPLFYHYGEDKDYVNRLRHHGYLVGYSPAVFGCHDRENRKISHEAWMRSEQIYLLTEYANIRYSLVQAFGYGVLAGIQKALQMLMQGKARDVAGYLAITGRLLKQTPKVIRFRKQSNQRKANYLHI